MAGLGTVANVSAILVAGVLGTFFGDLLKEKLQDGLLKATSICVIFIGIAGAMEQMLKISEGHLASNGSMMMVCCFIVGTLIGEIIDIEDKLERLGSWLKVKSKSEGDGGFVDAFVTASLTVCIGAMAIVGAIQDGMLGDYTTLCIKAVLDFIIIFVMASTMGKGCTFSAIPFGILQGSITILASFLAPVMTPLALSYISLTGSVMIFCVGVNLVWGKLVRVANMLPTLVIAVLWALYA